MNGHGEIAEQSTPQLTTKQLIAGFLGELQGSAGDKFIRGLAILNFVILFARPQHSIAVIGESKISVILSVIAGAFWLFRCRRGWNSSTKAMMIFLLLMTIRGAFARNNRWSFFLWLDVANQFTCYIFPIIVFCCNGKDLRRFVICSLLIGVYLGFYSLGHQGHGPGGFLNDENDLCLALILLLSFPLTFFLRQASFATRVTYGAGIVAILAGIVKTWSRGGFVGLVIGLMYLLWRSKAKMVGLFFALALIAGGMFFVPKAYWNEMSTIKQTNQGTAKARRELWATGIRMWLSPEWFLYGVGQGNSPFYMSEYEPPENRSAQRKSIGGRAVHSIFVQLVSELGLLGLTIFGSVVVFSVRDNNRGLKQTNEMAREFLKIQEAVSGIRKNRMEDPEITPELQQTKDETLIEEDITIHDIKSVSGRVREELVFIETMLIALNGCWVGLLGAAAFLSTLYYPPIWMVVGFSACVQFYLQHQLAYLVPLQKRIAASLSLNEKLATRNTPLQ